MSNLISTLFTTYPVYTLEKWYIDNGASRHFADIGKLSNLREKETNLEIILGDDATYPIINRI